MKCFKPVRLFIFLNLLILPISSHSLYAEDKAVLDQELRQFVDLTNLALSQNKIGQAEQASRMTLAYVDKKYKKKPERAEAYNLMAAVLFAKGDFTGAFDYHNQALSMMKKALGKEHPRYAQILVTRAGTYMTFGSQMAEQKKSGIEHFKRAEEDLLAAQQIFVKTKPEGSQWIETTKNALTQVRQKLDQAKKQA